MRRKFAVAPWPVTLKVVSVLGTALLMGVAIAAHRAIPVPSGFTHAFGLGVALVPVAVLVGALLFVVSDYEIEGTDLYVGRLFSYTRVPLAGLSRVWVEPGVCKGSLRVFGNGGLYSFTGTYYSKRLGRYRLFATDLSRAVALALPARTVVVTPAEPHAFVEYLCQRFADAKRDAPEVGR